MSRIYNHFTRINLLNVFLNSGTFYFIVLVNTGNGNMYNSTRKRKKWINMHAVFVFIKPSICKLDRFYIETTTHSL